MERRRLEEMSLEQLRDEAQKYLPAPADRNRLIDAIMTHLEANSPMADMLHHEDSSLQFGGQPLGQPQHGRNQPQDSQPVQVLAIEEIRHTINMCLQQLQQLTNESNYRPVVSPSGTDGSSRPTVVGASLPANAVTLLASQIPEFSGSEDECVQVWVQRVEKIAQVHRAPDDAVLLAAFSKLTKAARRWYEMQSGCVLESWDGLNKEIVKMFDRKISFYVAMQNIETRKWAYSKESFDQYAIDKLTLIHRLKLPTADMINLLVRAH